MNCTTVLSNILNEVKLNGVSVAQEHSLDPEYKYLSAILNVTPIQSVLLACVLESSFTRTGTSVKQICNLLKCTNIEFLHYTNELDIMVKRRIIQQNVTMTPFSESSGYVVTPKAIEAIRQDKAFIEEQITNLSSEQLFDRIGKLIMDQGNDGLKIEELKESLEELIEANQQLSFCKAIAEYNFSKCETIEFMVFMSLCNSYVNLGTDSISRESILAYVGAMSNLRTTFTAIKNERLMIQQKGLVEFGNDGGLSDTEFLSLSDMAKEKFFKDFSIDLDARRKCPDLISYESITNRELFHNDSVDIQVKRLAEILDNAHFREIQDRLETASMRKGFNCLFYGSPGTGKTETVYQLAKNSRRDILQIDLSKLKSKWVGESEKTIRSVFKYYQWLVRHSKVVPILLFNEADGIFGIRSKMAERSVDKMNNTIQNIILQEMEKMEGILIATTNLTENLDPAFERRFLYKVEFTMPEPSVRARIWESMMPFLSAHDSSSLAEHYTLSGGQIENISRKCAVENILDGTYPSFEAILKMCDSECLSTRPRRNRIGF